MPNMPKDLDVAKRAKVIEWLKTEVIDNVSRLFKALWEGKDYKGWRQFGKPDDELIHTGPKARLDLSGFGRSLVREIEKA